MYPTTDAKMFINSHSVFLWVYSGWWNDGSFNAADASFITAIKGGIADGLSWGYSLLQYIKNQTRLTTSSFVVCGRSKVRRP
jgi:hypothetical protein